MRTAFFTALVFALLTSSASAHSRHHHYRYYAHHHRSTVAATPWAGWGFWGEQQPSAVSLTRRHFSDGRPALWCGWYMRQVKGVADTAYNLARNWAHWGRPTSPHVGAVVVWYHHVGQIVGQSSDGEWIVNSGNDGHAVRTRARSLAGAIAFRE